MMKKLMFTLAALAVLTVNACKKDKTDDTNGLSGSGSVSANNYGFDGVSAGKFSSTKAGIVQTTVGGVTTFAISAIRDGGNESITITVLQKVGAVGKIQFGPAQSNGGIVISKDYSKAGDGALNYTTDRTSGSVSGGGEINITSLNGNDVEGTFYAVALNASGKQAFAEQGTFKGTIKQ